MPTHTRIRMFNTKQTYPNQALDNDLCQAVRAGNTIYVRGQIGTDFEGNLVGLGDPRAQAEQAMKNVKQLLEEAGSDLSHIVKTTTYLIDPRYREPVYQEVGKWLKGVFPISTGLVISCLFGFAGLAGERFFDGLEDFSQIQAQALSVRDLPMSIRLWPTRRSRAASRAWRARVSSMVLRTLARSA